jgi:hypothetical protein
VRPATWSLPSLPSQQQQKAAQEGEEGSAHAGAGAAAEVESMAGGDSSRCSPLSPGNPHATDVLRDGDIPGSRWGACCL